MIETPIQKMRAALRELDLAGEGVDATLQWALDCGPGAGVACLTASLAIQDAQRIVRANLAAAKVPHSAEDELIARGLPADYAALATGRTRDADLRSLQESVALSPFDPKEKP